MGLLGFMVLPSCIQFLVRPSACPFCALWEEFRDVNTAARRLQTGQPRGPYVHLAMSPFHVGSLFQLTEAAGEEAGTEQEQGLEQL